jgi:hypothetical protein
VEAERRRRTAGGIVRTFRPGCARRSSPLGRSPSRHGRRGVRWTARTDPAARPALPFTRLLALSSPRAVHPPGPRGRRRRCRRSALFPRAPRREAPRRRPPARPWSHPADLHHDRSPPARARRGREARALAGPRPGRGRRPRPRELARRADVPTAARREPARVARRRVRRTFLSSLRQTRGAAGAGRDLAGRRPVGSQIRSGAETQVDLAIGGAEARLIRHVTR